MRSPRFVNAEALKAVCGQLEIDALIAISPKNVFYYSGSPSARAHVRNHSWARTAGPIMPAALVLPNAAAVLLVPQFEESDTRQNTWIEEIRTFQAFVDSPIAALGAAVIDHGLARSRIGYEADETSAAEFEALKKVLPGAEFVPADERMEWIRSIKTPAELAHMKLAAELTDEAILEGFRSARVGDTEWEIHSRIIAGVLSRGGEYCRGLLQAGSSNDLSFGGTGRKELERGDIIHIDYAAYYEGYPANLSRVGVVGEPTIEQQRRYADLLAVQREVMRFMKPGVTGSEVFWYCREVFTQFGYTHTAPIVGHNLGLGYHDRPMITAAETMSLEANNVVALEPLIEWAFHIQDHVVVTPSGGVLQSDKFDTSGLFVIGGGS
jgi:Xaa-Pro aminopeptidase